jgi:GalNAc-alpha-(1->4)-GalNAc-alpha-(1->3)-diNAcBac-PP-undecaprenol alpha-1,4-N-acetyl-D-galactosaminyltransferase
VRLTFIIHSLTLCSGLERSLSKLANYWVEKGWEITIVKFIDDKGQNFFYLDPRIVHSHVDFFLKPSNPIQRLAFIFKRHLNLRQAVKDSKPDLVISSGTYPIIRTLISIVGLQIPVIIREAIDVRRNPITKQMKLARRLIYPLASSLVALNQDVMTYYEKILKSKVRLIPNSALLPSGSESDFNKKELNKPTKVLMALGRLSEEKGFDLLLNAFASIAPKFPDWDLVIWGEGDYRSSLEELRKHLKLEDRVQFPGSTKDPSKEMQQADLFIFPSKYEGFPNVLCEAMACGLPVISFDCPSGPRDIIQDGVDGILVPPEDVPALTREMERLMSDESERHRLAEKAPEVAQRFSQERIMGMWEDLIFELTGKNVSQKA